MQCELCKKNSASVHFKQACAGLVKEMHVCEECAAANGLNVEVPLSLADFLFGNGPAQARVPASEDRSCPVCHARWSDFQKTSRLGCWFCYETFAEELMPALASMHKGMKHVGKVPAGEIITEETAGLRKALEDAVAAQNFEEAARLRDQFKGLKSENVCSGKAATPDAD